MRTKVLISWRIVWPSRICWCPSLLAVSHVEQSALFVLTEAALYLQPTGETPFEKATWNLIFPAAKSIWNKDEWLTEKWLQKDINKPCNTGNNHGSKKTYAGQGIIQHAQTYKSGTEKNWKQYKKIAIGSFVN